MRTLLLFLCLFCACPLAAAPAKKMLVVYKASDGVTARENETRWHLEPLLAKQGWKLDYHDVDRSLPSDAQMAPYAAVASWHRTAVYKSPLEYVRWMRNQVVSGRKVVVFGNFGAYTADQKTWLTNDELNQFFVPFGLEYGAAYSGDAAQLQVSKHSGPAKVPPALSYYLLFRSLQPTNKPHLVISRKDLPNSESAMVVTTPKGAMAADTYIYRQNGKQLQWLVDRQALLSQALASPAPPLQAPGPRRGPTTSAAGKLSSPPQAVSAGGHLLALYKSTEGYDDKSNYVARFLSPTLKELGYTYDAHDITKGLPDAATMAKYSGVVSWYQTASMEHAAAYCRWLLDQIMAGRKVVILGNLGAYQELDRSSNPPTERWLLNHEYNTFMYPFGLEFKAMWTKDPKVLNVASRDSEVVPFLEPQHIGHYYWIQSVNPENKPYLVLNRSDAKNSDSAIVVRTPYGGYALESYLFRDVSGKGEYRWHVDMKKFLADSLTYTPTKLPVAVDLKVRPSTPRSVPASSVLPPEPSLPAGTQEIKRRVLAFYQRDNEELSDHNRVHEAAETFLNHLGLVVDYHAIEDGLPSPAQMAPYRGVITWFQSASIPNAQAYADWLKVQIDAGRRVVILGDYGAFQDKKMSTQVDPSAMFKALGVDWRSAGPVTGVKANRINLVTTGTASIEFMDPLMCKGERPIDLNEPDLKRGWPVFLSANPANKVYLRLKDKDGQPCDAIMITPHGALVAGEFLEWIPPAPPIKAESMEHAPVGTGPAIADEIKTPELRIDAFRFFAEAFQTQDIPVCDVTTLNGSRIYFSHIDGDAMQGISFVDRASINAEMLYRELLSTIPLPVTVSFVTNNLEFRATPTYKRELEAARKIMALPWVEPATHTRTHPFNWRLGDVRRREGDNSGSIVRLLPDYKREIVDSIDFTNQLVTPANKPCKVLLWSGRCNPTEECLQLTDGMGVSNMNGGDPVYDSKHPHLIGVAPLYASVNGRYQFHTCAAGDFYYTGAWTKDFDGMKNLVEFFQYTEEPRRLRAMNLYYHFYLAEKELGLQGLKVAMNYVISQRPAPMFVSDYIDVVKDMIVAKVGRDQQGNIVVANTGAMRTIRLENQPLQPDLTRSQGVIGFNRAGNRLYIHLDESPVHRIALAASPANGIYVERASHYLNQWSASPTAMSFSLKGTGPASFTLAGVSPNKVYTVDVARQERKSVRSDANGKLTWQGTFTGYNETYPVRISSN